MLMKSSLATKEILSPNRSTRKSPITKFTPHHTAVVAPAENIANGFTYVEREASANYIIDNDGTIICSVPEEFRAWTSGNADNDHQAITIEVCNETGAPEWRVSDAALEALINLGVDICKRYNLSGFTWTGDKNGTLTIHKMFQATACPGPYLESKMPYIADEITKRLKEDKPMVYKINIDDLKKQGYTSVSFEFGAATENVVTPPVTHKPTIEEGSKVKIKPGAKSYDGVSMADFVYNKVYTVDELKGDRAVLDKNGLHTAFHIDNLILV
jgi:hypothetical protein